MRGAERTWVKCMSANSVPSSVVSERENLPSNRCSFASSGQTANQSRCLPFICNTVTPPLTHSLFFLPLASFSPSRPQVSEGLQADASLLDDSDLEARLNRWNLGVSPRAAPRAPEAHVGATSG